MLFVECISFSCDIVQTRNYKCVLFGISGLEFRLHGRYKFYCSLATESGISWIKETTFIVQRKVSSVATDTNRVFLGLCLFSPSKRYIFAPWLFSEGNCIYDTLLTTFFQFQYFFRVWLF